MKRVRILGVPIDPTTKSELLERISAIITSKLPSQIATVNPEFIVAAQRNDAFRAALADAEFCIADGIGIQAAGSYLRQPIPDWQPAKLLAALIHGLGVGIAILTRSKSLQSPIPTTITGVDLVEHLAELAETNGWRCYFAGGVPGRAQEAARALQRKFPGLIVAGAEDGPPDPRFRSQPFEHYEADFVDRIVRARPDILFLALGAPQQDLFIARHKTTLNIPICIGVGGSFDFLAGAVDRAPQWLRHIGLEWLWRLFIEPWRWRRILSATVTFSWYVLRERLRAH